MVSLDQARLVNERASLEGCELQKVDVQQEVTKLEEVITELKEEFRRLLRRIRSVVAQVKKNHVGGVDGAGFGAEGDCELCL